jgi:hypothetical protein
MRNSSRVAWFAGLLLSLSAFLSAPALAGQAPSWRPVSCQAPQAPALAPHDPERPADDLNARTGAYNAYVAVAEDYMNCVSREGQRDAEASALAVTRAAQDVILKTQAEIKAAAKGLQAPSGQ